MFVASVLAFLCGIYLETLYILSFWQVLISFLIAAICASPLLKRLPYAAIPVILAGFLLAGMVRIAPIVASERSNSLPEGKSLYEASVVESSPQTKIVRITAPASARGTKAVFRHPTTLGIDDRVNIFGEIRELTPTFKNPHLITWKWLKRLEGVNHEVRGVLVSATPGSNYIEAARNWLKERVERSGAHEAGIIMALTIGDKTGVDDSIKQLFLRTGTSHILAVSGFQVAIVSGFLFCIFRWLLRRSRVLRLSGRDTRYAALLTIPFPFFFMLLAGCGASIIRATIMVAVFMVALVLERNRDIINTVFLSGLIILLLYPHSLFMPSFQLSFVSVLFIVLIMQKIYPFIKGLGVSVKWLLSSLLTTLAAAVGTLPVVLYHFWGFNPFCVVHNLISVPLMCLVATPLSFAGMVLPFGEYLLSLAGLIIRFNIFLLNFLDVGYIYPIIRPNLLEILMFFAFILSLVHWNWKPVRAVFLLMLVPGLCIYLFWTYEQRFHNGLCINVIDVGLGDAILVEGPGGVRMLVDGGGSFKGDYDVGKSVVAPILLSKKIRTLDYVVSTHPHADHIGGLTYILSHFNVNRLAVGGYHIEEEKFDDLLQLASDRHIPVEQWKHGDSYVLAHGMEIHVLHPDRDSTWENLNDSSLVFRMLYKRHAFLLTADIGTEVEEDLILSGAPLRANVMKVPHHGSKNSNSPAFIRAVAPDVAVLSVGPGIRGLPGSEALQSYEKLAIPLFRTDRNGFIRICSDGEKITCEPFLR